MLISILIPCYNEQNSIVELLKRVNLADIGPHQKEIIVVDDCSKDNTRAVLEANKSLITKLVFHEKNQGKGGGIITALKHATGDVMIIQDADLEYDPAEYLRLLKPIYENRADVVYGSRFAGGDEHRVLYFWHMVANKFLTLVGNMVTNLNLTDMETCYKVFTKETAQHLNLVEPRFGFDPEITVQLARLSQVRFYEVGISYSGRTFEEGKKISWKDGFTVLKVLFFQGILNKKKVKFR